ncbi:MAG: hypothetical protein CFE23_05140, partial [Flavobacterium sp. BFFFF1]|uniref:hypothetical protein n=1 Tax=Flavobacterium sp. BFFFF1 TaxID=2015557 RepID=UPI000BCBD423
SLITGNQSLATGNKSFATGNESFATGNESLATGNKSLVLRYDFVRFGKKEVEFLVKILTFNSF